VQQAKVQAKKKFHIKELTKVQPKTINQKIALDRYFSGHNMAMLGSAGTGKTFLAMYMALTSVLAGEHENVVLVRSAVPVREIGYLPGDEREKTEVYEQPYKPMADQLFPYSNCYDNLKNAGQLFFYTTSFIRGLTFYDSVVIVDECQSLNAHELDSILTRLGDNCRLILCGDGIQSDLKKAERKGFYDIMRILGRVSDFSIINFTVDDIVRSGFVRDYITCREQLGLEIC
jgi:phosphate starvation-inducible PhoH-like protein